MRTLARDGSTKITCTSNALLEPEEEWIKQLGIELLKDIFWLLFFRNFSKALWKLTFTKCSFHGSFPQINTQKKWNSFALFSMTQGAQTYRKKECNIRNQRNYVPCQLSGRWFCGNWFLWGTNVQRHVMVNGEEGYI